MRTEPTVVTAFFDMHRGEWRSSGRSIQRYIDAFSLWTRIHNKLVVYTNADVAEQVKRIRAEYGLLEATEIIVIDDYLALDFALYQSIEKAMKSHSSKMFHLKPNHPESWNPVYNYVMLLKWWCVCDAIRRGSTSETVAWIDFGFNNCDTLYTEPNDFDFTWLCDTDDRINLFCINEPDDTPVFEIVQKMNTYVQGCSIVGPAKLWPEFAKLVRESMIEMNNVGFADDDQVFMLMAYRKKPDLFKLNICPWFSIFSVTSEQSFHIRPHIETKGMKARLRVILNRIKERQVLHEYLKQQKQILLHKNTLND